MKNYYDTLQLSENTSLVEIQDAYKKLAKLYNYGANQLDSESETKFREVQQAYDILSKQHRKDKVDIGKAVDSSRKSPSDSAAFYNFSGDLFDDTFEDLARMTNKGAVTNKGNVQDKKLTGDISQQKYLDAKKDKVEIKSQCTHCGNSGALFGLATCPYCSGSGNL